ncbi:MAG: MFS transporter, partial [Actinomycetes bacterium]
MTSETNKEAVVHQPADPRRWRLLGLLGLAQFMLILDVTVVAIALPHMGADLGLGRDSLTWVVSAYTLAFGGLMLLGGRVADLFGPKPVVLAGLAVFTAASLATGLATSAELAIGGRIAQGVGAAMLSPAALSIVIRLFDGDERNRALGIWSALGAGGAAIGVLLGGALTAGPGWAWVFLINVPIGVVVALLLLRLLPALPAWGGSGGLDVVGALLVTAATGLLILGFIEAGDDGWTSGRTIVLVVAGVVGYAVLAGWLRRPRHPLIDPALVSRRPVLSGTFVLFIATGLMVAVFFLGTFYLQSTAGHGPLTTGLLFLPVAAATMAGAQ